MRDFNDKCVIETVSQKQVSEFKTVMNNCWDTKLLVDYIETKTECNILSPLLLCDSVNCVDILKQYLVDFSMRYSTKITAEHMILVEIFRFVNQFGYLPKFENIT